MNDIKITKLEKEPEVRFGGKRVILPEEIQKKIDTYWQMLMDAGKSYTRGEVFIVSKKEENDGTLHILVEKTDYAHYLYCQNVDADLAGYGTCVVFTACLVETADGKLILGKMGKHTACAGIFQLSGGGIDNSDIFSGRFDLQGNISKELREELGIDIQDKTRIRDFYVAYLKQGGAANKIAVIYRAQLSETAKKFLEKYKMFVRELNKKSQTSEFDDVVAIECSKEGVERFLVEHRSMCDEYMSPLLQNVCRH